MPIGMLYTFFCLGTPVSHHYESMSFVTTLSHRDDWVAADIPQPYLCISFRLIQ
jgi:hypothetical protein